MKNIKRSNFAPFLAIPLLFGVVITSGCGGNHFPIPPEQFSFSYYAQEDGYNSVDFIPQGTNLKGWTLHVKDGAIVPDWGASVDIEGSSGRRVGLLHDNDAITDYTHIGASSSTLNYSFCYKWDSIEDNPSWGIANNVDWFSFILDNGWYVGTINTTFTFLSADVSDDDYFRDFDNLYLQSSWR